MEYAKGQYVVYNGFEICRIGDTIKKCFDGINENEYYTLFPKDIKCTYYVPADIISSVVRPVMTKEQLLELIDALPDISGKWVADKNDRKHDFSDAIKKGDYSRIIPLMHGIYNEKNNHRKNGKSLLNDDRRNFELAKKLLLSEIAFSFGIDVSKAEKFIEDRIRERS